MADKKAVRKAPKLVRGTFQFDFSVTGLTRPEADKLLDQIIKTVERRNRRATVAGGFTVVSLGRSHVHQE